MSAQAELGRPRVVPVVLGDNLRQASEAMDRADLAPRTGFVYFVRCGQFIKIGYSRAPESRIGSLQTANPLPIYVLAIRPGTPEIEANLHIAFQHFRTRGEWYRATPELVDFIKEKLR